MTAAGTQAGARPARGRGRSVLRALWLHLVGRGVPAALLVLAACAVALRAMLGIHWIAGDEAAARQLALVIETAPAVVIAVTTRSPFGEPERVTGRRLPWLRLTSVLVQVVAAVGVLAVAAATARLPGGVPDLVRNVAGMTGLGLLCAAVLGGSLAWGGPLTYLVATESALASGSVTRWLWPTRPQGDHGAALYAGLLLAAGTAVITVRGARDAARE